MKHFLLLVLSLSFIFLISCHNSEEQKKTKVLSAEKSIDSKAEYAMVIHGGAGTIRKAEMSEEKYHQYYSALDTALTIGENILKNGGTSLDAIEASIRYMEDVPLFNSGRGAVFTNAGINELDASIMIGSDRNAGAVGGVTNVRHPVTAARKVMEKSPHVLLTGKGAETFAKEEGLEIVDPSYFKTQKNWDYLQEVLKREKDQGYLDEVHPDWKYGTVGAVALDKAGNIAAATSTGGMTNKKYNRIGDSPIIGAGTFADNKTCGVSCTGHGEFFIRYAVAYDVAARMEYKNESVQEAADFIINKKLVDAKGAGGLIALDGDGNVAMPFNTEGMYRGYVKPGEKVILMYEEEK